MCKFRLNPKALIASIKVPLMALIITACGGGGGTQAPSAPGVFSHSAYNFAVQGIIPDGAEQTIARIAIDEFRLKREVAAILGITDDEQIAALSEKSSANGDYDYEIIDISIKDEDVSSLSRTLFSVRRDQANPALIEIRVSNPTGANLDYDYLLNELGFSSFTVEITADIPGAENEAERRFTGPVRVFLLSGGALDYSDLLSFNVGRISGNTTYNARLAENTPAAQSANMILPRDGLSNFGVSLRTPRTLFFALRTGANISNPCLINGEAVYIDNVDYRVKASYEFDYEEGVSVPGFTSCRLAVSQNGVDYSFVALPLSNASGISGEVANAADYPNLAQANITAGSDAVPRGGCGSGIDHRGQAFTNMCYYVSLNLEITDVNEAPVLAIGDDPREGSFAGANETVGVDGASPVLGTLPQTGNIAGIFPNGFNDTRRIFIYDRDYSGSARGSHRPVNISKANADIRVTPEHGQGLFRLHADSTSSENRDYLLAVNASALDYERFAAADLDANGRAIYRINIKVEDLSGMSATRSFNYEVKDVVYPSITPRFEKSARIQNNSDGSIIYVLPGADSFASNLLDIGTFAAVDPETGNDDDLVYSFLPSDADFGSNFALEKNPNRNADRRFAARLSIGGTALRQNQSATLTLMAIHKSLLLQPSILNNSTLRTDAQRFMRLAAISSTDPRAITSITLIVNPVVYRSTQGVIVLDRTNAITFSSGHIPASIIEASAAVNVTYNDNTQGLVDKLDQQPTATEPRFNFVGGGPISGSDTSRFSIDRETGVISPRTPLEFPAVYRLPVYVSNGTAAFNFASHDVMTVTVVVTDENTPPRFSAHSSRLGILATQPTYTKLTLGEDRATNGAELLRFTLNDDNDDAITDFQPSISANAYAEVVLEETNNRIEGVVRLTDKLNYEKLPSDFDAAATDILTITVTDSGAYEYNTESGRALPQLNSQGMASSITLNLTVADFREAPMLTRDNQVGLILESAAIGDDVDHLNITLANEDDFLPGDDGSFNVSRFSFAITGVFRGILSPRMETSDNGPPRIILSVADPQRLENLGDGRTFRSSIRSRDTDNNLQGNQLEFSVKIQNNPANSNLTAGLERFVAKLNSLNGGTGLTISENDANPRVSYNWPVSNFSLTESDIIADAGELLFGRTKSVNLEASVAAVSFSHSNELKGLTKARILRLIGGNRRTLQLIDGNFIDEALYGDLSFSLQIRDRIDRHNPPISRPVGIDVIPAATLKRAVYRPAVGRGLTVAGNVPRYSITYSQSEFAAPLTPDSTPTALHFTFRGTNRSIVNQTEVSDTGVENNDVIRIEGDEFHGIVNIPALRGNFIDRAERNDFNISIPILDRTTGDEIDISSYQILVEREGALRVIQEGSSRNNLIAAARNNDFNKYFNIEIDDSTQPQQLRILQKSFTATALNSSGQPEQRPAYNVLDTFPLFEERSAINPPSRELNYYIRAITDNKAQDAAYRALAQFNVEVTSIATNEATQVMAAALVPKNFASGFRFSNPSATTNARSFTAEGGQLVLSIPENGVGIQGLTPNNFGDYVLMVQFENADAMKRREAPSDIRLRIAAPTGSEVWLREGRNIATDGNLVDLRLPSATTVIPSAGAELGDTTEDFDDDASTTYMRQYDLAMAKNLAGEASITVEVDDREAGSSRPLARSSTTLRINVEARDRPAPDLVVGARAGSNSIANIDAGLREDQGVLAIAGRDITLDATVRNEEAGAFAGSKSAAVVLDNIGQGVNNRSQSFFVKPAGSGSIVRYTEHGWGTHSFTYIVTWTEERGFGDTPVEYRAPAIVREVQVAAAPDPTTINTRRVPSINADEFMTFNNPAAVAKSGSILFSDGDLAFDTIANALGTRLTIDVTADSTEAPTLEFTPASINLPETLRRDEDPGSPLLTVPLSYRIILSSAQAGEALAASYDIGFAFDGAGTDLAATNPANDVRIEFTKEISNPELVSFRGNSLDLTNPANKARVNEDDNGVTVATITIQDGDIRTARPGTFDFSSGLRVLNSANEEVSGLIEWRDSSISRTSANGRISNDLILSRAVDDADIDNYNISWKVTDGNAREGAETLSGFILMRAAGRNDSPTEFEIGFASTAQGGSGIDFNYNQPANGFFQISTLSYKDLDFIEKDPRINPGEISYRNLEFQMDSPGDENDYTCSLNAAQGVANILFVAGFSANAVVNRQEGSASIANRRLQYANGGAARDLTPADIINSATCTETLTIGSSISSIEFSGINIGDSRTASDSQADKRVTLDPAYRIVGYRAEAVAISGAGATNFTFTGGFSSTHRATFTLTDNDADDGVAHAATGPSATVRSGSDANRVWGGSASLRLDTSSCPGITATLGQYTSTSVTGQSMISISLTYDGTDPALTDSCVISYRDGEDGQTDEARINIRYQLLPQVEILGLRDGQALGNYTVGAYRVNFRVTDTDPNDGERPVLSVLAEPADVCQFGSGDLTGLNFNGGTATTASASLNLLLAGSQCTISASVYEGDDPSMSANASISLALEHSPFATGDLTYSASNPTTVYATAEQIVLETLIRDQDRGDGDQTQVGLAYSLGDCAVSLSESAAVTSRIYNHSLSAEQQASLDLGSSKLALYISRQSGGSCDGSITLSITELGSPPESGFTRRFTAISGTPFHQELEFQDVIFPFRIALRNDIPPLHSISIPDLSPYDKGIDLSLLVYTLGTTNPMGTLTADRPDACQTRRVSFLDFSGGSQRFARVIFAPRQAGGVCHLTFSVAHLSVNRSITVILNHIPAKIGDAIFASTARRLQLGDSAEIEVPITNQDPNDGEEVRVELASTLTDCSLSLDPDQSLLSRTYTYNTQAIGGRATATIYLGKAIPGKCDVGSFTLTATEVGSPPSSSTTKTFTTVGDTGFDDFVFVDTEVGPIEVNGKLSTEIVIPRDFAYGERFNIGVNITDLEDFDGTPMVNFTLVGSACNAGSLANIIQPNFAASGIIGYASATYAHLRFGDCALQVSTNETAVIRMLSIKSVQSSPSISISGISSPRIKFGEELLFRIIITSRDPFRDKNSVRLEIVDNLEGCSVLFFNSMSTRLGGYSSNPVIINGFSFGSITTFIYINKLGTEAGNCGQGNIVLRATEVNDNGSPDPAEPTTELVISELSVTRGGKIGLDQLSFREPIEDLLVNDSPRANISIPADFPYGDPLILSTTLFDDPSILANADVRFTTNNTLACSFGDPTYGSYIFGVIRPVRIPLIPAKAGEVCEIKLSNSEVPNFFRTLILRQQHVPVGIGDLAFDDFPPTQLGDALELSLALTNHDPGDGDQLSIELEGDISGCMVSLAPGQVSTTASYTYDSQDLGGLATAKIYVTKNSTGSCGAGSLTLRALEEGSPDSSRASRTFTTIGGTGGGFDGISFTAIAYPGRFQVNGVEFSEVRIPRDFLFGQTLNLSAVITDSMLLEGQPVISFTTDNSRDCILSKQIQPIFGNNSMGIARVELTPAIARFSCTITLSSVEGDASISRELKIISSDPLPRIEYLRVSPKETSPSAQHRPFLVEARVHDTDPRDNIPLLVELEYKGAKCEMTYNRYDHLRRFTFRSLTGEDRLQFNYTSANTADIYFYMHYSDPGLIFSPNTETCDGTLILKTAEEDTLPNFSNTNISGERFIFENPTTAFDKAPKIINDPENTLNTRIIAAHLLDLDSTNIQRVGADSTEQIAGMDYSILVNATDEDTDEGFEHPITIELASSLTGCSVAFDPTLGSPRNIWRFTDTEVNITRADYVYDREGEDSEDLRILVTRYGGGPGNCGSGNLTITGIEDGLSDTAVLMGGDIRWKNP